MYKQINSKFLIALTLLCTFQMTWALDRATFSMFCYWTGEATLGTIDGVEQTKIGHLDHNEVVEVLYDPKKTNIKQMSDALIAQRSFYSFIHRNQKEKKAAAGLLTKKQMKDGSENIRYIKAKHTLQVRRPDLLKIGLTEKQALKLNTWAHYNFHSPMPDILTDEQKNKLKSK